MKYVTDSYWKNIFVGCACNQFPPRSRYSIEHHQIILTMGKDKEDGKVYPLSDKPKNFYKECIDIFRKNLNLFSVNDIKFSTELLLEVDDGIDRDAISLWKDVKPKSAKDTLIADYVIDILKEQYHLSLIQSRLALIVIHLGFQFKHICGSDVVLEHGKIRNIDGIYYNETMNKIMIDQESLNEHNNRTTVIKPTPKQKIFHAIDRYLLHLEKIHQNITES